MMLSTFLLFIGHLYIFFGEMSVQILCLFLKLGYLSFCCWVVRVLYIYILVTSPLSSMWFAKIFSHSAGCLLSFLMISFSEFLILMKSNLSIFSFVAYTFGIVSKKSLSNPRSWIFTPMFFSWEFYSLALTFRSLIHSEVIFVYGVM